MRVLSVSDVVVENFLPGKLAQYGLGFADVAAVNPRAVYCSITGFGQTGPYADRAGYDLVAQAMGGLMHITGVPHESVRIGVAMVDILTGMHAMSAVLASLLARCRTGSSAESVDAVPPVHIDANLLDAAVAALANAGSNWLVGRADTRRWGSAHENIVPYQAFQAADGPFVLAVGSDRQFERLCSQVLGDGALWSSHPQWAKNAGRVADRSALATVLQERLRVHPRSEWFARLEAAGIPYGPVNSIEEVFADAHVQARGMVVNVAHPTAGPIQLTGHPVCYNGMRPAVRRPPPLVGQHTREVLAEVLRVSAEQLDRLQSQRIIA
jgi:succinate---hydroxymethylglutarate CoA-transferase